MSKTLCPSKAAQGLQGGEQTKVLVKVKVRINMIVVTFVLAITHTFMLLQYMLNVKGYQGFDQNISMF